MALASLGLGARNGSAPVRKDDLDVSSSAPRLENLPLSKTSILLHTRSDQLSLLCPLIADLRSILCSLLLIFAHSLLGHYWLLLFHIVRAS